jgi:hypothetical protein
MPVGIMANTLAAPENFIFAVPEDCGAELVVVDAAALDGATGI